MKLAKEVMAELMVQPGESAALGHRSTKATKWEWRDSDHRKLAETDLREYVRELAKAQRLFWANGTRALLVILQAMDAAGKDGTIRHVMSGVNPQGCKVEAFKQPSAEELNHGNPSGMQARCYRSGA